MIETGALNETSPFTCTRNNDFSKIEWTKSDEQDETTSCTKCTAGCVKVEGDNDKVCEIIRNSEKGLASDVHKRVARRVADDIVVVIVTTYYVFEFEGDVYVYTSVDVYIYT